MKTLFIKVVHRYSSCLVVALLVMILVTTGVAVSCESRCNSGYKTFAFKEDDVRFHIGGVILEHPLFTFEYPCSFYYVDINRAPDLVINPNITQVFFRMYGEGNTFTDETLEVLVHKPDAPGARGDTDAKTALDNAIASDSGNPDFLNFQILERTTVNVDDIPAEYVAYSYHQPAKEELRRPPQDRIIRFVAFNYRGFVWKLEMDCFSESAEETEPYFEHLIETFQILE